MTLMKKYFPYKSCLAFIWQENVLLLERNAVQTGAGQPSPGPSGESGGPSRSPEPREETLSLPRTLRGWAVGIGMVCLIHQT